jgi:hypothetical protein
LSGHIGWGTYAYDACVVLCMGEIQLHWHVHCSAGCATKGDVTVVGIEKEIFRGVDEDEIKKKFQHIKHLLCLGHLESLEMINSLY